MKNRLSISDIKTLKESLPYMHIKEIKDLCNRLSLSTTGQKGAIIQRILYYCENGTVLANPKIPSVSMAKKDEIYQLDPMALILKGAYKNNEETRTFMKSIVGDYFHFTAFGQDWIKERWLQGNPPTYEEFAEYWKKEYESRKFLKSKPKAEWAYLNFIQKNSKYGSSNVVDWEEERFKHVSKVWKIFEKIKP